MRRGAGRGNPDGPKRLPIALGAMHRVVRVLRFVLCLVSLSEQLASIWPLAENCSKLKAIHSMRRGAGRGNPDGPKRLPIALGAIPVHRVVRILLFVSCLVPVSVQLASIWPLAENCSQLKAIYSMRRGLEVREAVNPTALNGCQ